MEIPGLREVRAERDAAEVQVELELDALACVLHVDEGTESAQVDDAAACDGLVGVVVPTSDNFSGVVQGVGHGALPGTVRPEEQRDRLQVELDPVADALEILDLDPGDHAVASDSRSGSCGGTASVVATMVFV